MKKLVFPTMILAIFLGITILNGKGPILGERVQVGSIHSKYIDIRFGYIK